MTIVNDIKSIIRENSLLMIKQAETQRIETVKEVKEINLNTVVSIGNLIRSKDISIVSVNDDNLVEIVNIEKEIGNGNKKEYEKSFVSEEMLKRKRNNSKLTDKFENVDKETKNTEKNILFTDEEVKELQSLEQIMNFLKQSK